jgi:hypothetical protein
MVPLGIGFVRPSLLEGSPIMKAPAPYSSGRRSRQIFLSASPIIGSMPPVSPPSFDVFIIGGETVNAAGRTKLARLIAIRYRIAAPAVEDGLGGGQCLVGSAMTEVGAKRLAEELADLGAETLLQPAGVALPLSTKGARLAASSIATPPPKNGSDIVRCPIHALSYDRSKSLGCLRCLQPAREAARAMQLGARTRRDFRALGDLIRSPLQRAFAGLALALLVGFVPAAYYALRISGAEVKRIRARQAELSPLPGTQAVTEEFDKLDAAVSDVRSTGLKRTAVIWVMVSAIGGFAWQKLVRSPDPS